MANTERTTIVLIRHAESYPSNDIPEPEWPLSERGIEQAEWLSEQLKTSCIDVIVSSPFRRAVETLYPLASRLGCVIKEDAQLRERKLCEGQRDDWYQLVRRAWTDFSFALPNCESGISCQERMRACLARLAEKYCGRVVAACSHGNAIGLYLSTIDPAFGFDDWSKMRNPDAFWIEYYGKQPYWHREFRLLQYLDDNKI